MKLPDLDTLTFPDPDTAPVVLHSLDGEADVTFARSHEDGSVTVTFTYRFPHESGTLNAEIDAEPEDVERVYRLMRGATALAARGIVADKLRDPELPPLKMLQEYEVPAIVFKPLVLEEAGRRRVLDVRAGAVTSGRREHLDHRAPSENPHEWGYLTGVTVHRVTCTSPKAKQVRAELESSSDWRSMAWKSGLDRRPAWFEEFLPHVAAGELYVQMCLTCKPLGRYSRWVNERIPSGVLSTADAELIAEYMNAADVPRSHWELWWRRWAAMTPKRWTALAELIAFLDHEVNGARGPAAADVDGDTVE